MRSMWRTSPRPIHSSSIDNIAFFELREAKHNKLPEAEEEHKKNTEINELFDRLDAELFDEGGEGVK